MATLEETADLAIDRATSLQMKGKTGEQAFADAWHGCMLAGSSQISGSKSSLRRLILGLCTASLLYATELTDDEERSED